MYCINCGIQLEDDMKFCPKCGGQQKQVPDGFSFQKSLGDDCQDNEILVEQGKNRKEGARKLDKQECRERASALSNKFNSSLALKIIGIILKVICLPLIPIFYGVSFFITFVASIGTMGVGIILFLVAVGFIISVLSGEWVDVSIFIIGGIILSIIAIIINIIPSIFLGIAQILAYFVFGIHSYKENE